MMPLGSVGEIQIVDQVVVIAGKRPSPNSGGWRGGIVAMRVPVVVVIVVRIGTWKRGRVAVISVATVREGNHLEEIYKELNARELGMRR